ncbi:hypothetical protein [Neisseria lactamica]|uniref:hypothetical protein n=1 Tax=Neisseria lactamica TaxID=486 RepID=UPI001EFDEB20|nr:hypothetical protein [Neisseria lactamica]
MKIPSFLYACTERKAQIVTETAAVPKSGIRCAAGAEPDKGRPDAPAASDGIGGGTQSASGVCYNPIFPTSRFATLPRYQN